MTNMRSICDLHMSDLDHIYEYRLPESPPVRGGQLKAEDVNLLPINSVSPHSEYFYIKLVGLKQETLNNYS